MSETGQRFFTGKCAVTQSGSGTGYWQVAVTNFNSPGGAETTDIAIGDFLHFSDAGTLYALEVTEIISAFHPNATIRVSNVGITGIGSVSSTSDAFISRRTPNLGLTPFVSNTSDNENQIQLENTMLKIDAAIGATVDAENGLTLTTGTIELGGDLTKDTVITNEGFDITIQGNGEVIIDNNAKLFTENIKLERTNNSTGTAVINITTNPGGNLALPAGENHLVKIIINQLDIAVVVDPNASETIAGVATYTLLPKSSIILHFNAVTSDWTIVGASPNQSIISYYVPVTDGLEGTSLMVTATAPGISASYASNNHTITIPAGVQLLTAHLIVMPGAVQASGDGGGFTNWTTVQFVGTHANLGLTTLRTPFVQKTSIPPTGALAADNSATIDLDNTPLISAIASGTGNITMRVSGMVVGAQGYQLSFTGF